VNRLIISLVVSLSSLFVLGLHTITYVLFGISILLFLVRIIDNPFYSRLKKECSGPLDYHYKNDIGIRVDESEGCVHGEVYKKYFKLPLSDIYFRYKEETESITEAKVASGMINGQLATWRTGDVITYDKKTGFTRISVYEKNKEIGSFLLPNSEFESNFKNKIDKLNVLSRAIATKAESASKEEEAKAQELRKQASLEASNRTIKEFVTQCNAVDPFVYSNLEATGDVQFKWCIVADRAGRGGVAYIDPSSGIVKWTGGWRGARAGQNGDYLEILLDDPDYRHKHLKEHRINIDMMFGVVEWMDRINILSQVR
jgi:hypothetical protein